MAGLVPAIHVFHERGFKAWMPGTSPGMTGWFWMSPDLAFWLALALKMAVTAGFVVAAAMVAEKSGPAIGAMIATLPIAAAPSYVFLALDHDAAFIARSALGSLSANAVTGIFSLIYVILAQLQPLAVSLAGALAVWFTLAFALSAVEWTIVSVVAFNVVVFAVCIPLVMRYCHVPMPRVVRRWYDMPMRAGMVACLVAIVVGTSSRVGPSVTGLLAVFPIVLTSLILIFQPRIGGPATAALMANTIWGLAGFSTALVVLYLGAITFGTWIAYGLSLATSLIWNFVVWSVRRRIAQRAR